MDIRERMQQLIGDYAGTENLRVVDVAWLKEIEWGGTFVGDYGNTILACCPDCEGLQPDHRNEEIGQPYGGHLEDCNLAKLIGSGGDDGDQR